MAVSASATARLLSLSRWISGGATLLMLSLSVFFFAESYTEGRHTGEVVQQRSDAITRRLQEEKANHQDEIEELSQAQLRLERDIKTSREQLIAISPDSTEAAIARFVENDTADAAACPQEIAGYKQSHADFCQGLRATQRDNATLFSLSEALRQQFTASYKFICEDGGQLVDKVESAERATCIVQSRTARLSEHMEATQQAFELRVGLHEARLKEMQDQMNTLSLHQQELGDVIWRRQRAEASSDRLQQQLADRERQLRQERRTTGIQDLMTGMLAVKHVALGVVCLIGAIGAFVRLLHLMRGFGSLRLTTPRSDAP